MTSPYDITLARKYVWLISRAYLPERNHTNRDKCVTLSSFLPIRDERINQIRTEVDKDAANANAS